VSPVWTEITSSSPTTAMTTQSSRGSKTRFTISSSPSLIPAPSIESPDTGTTQVLVMSLIRCLIRSIQPSK
jgi:hypothetical protein